MTVRCRPWRVFRLAFCLWIGLFLLSCTARDTTALSLLLGAVRSQSALPAGDVYVLPDSPSLRALNTTDTQGQSVRVADAALLSAAFGEGGGKSMPSLLSGVDDGAMRFATAASPCELIVLHCVSRAEADKVATLLHERLDILRREHADDDGVLADARVVVIGKYALLVICNDTEAALHALQ